MPELLRYGVFNLGRVWTLIGEDGYRTQFTSRESALAAARTIRSIHKGLGRDVELLTLDDACELRAEPETAFAEG